MTSRRTLLKTLVLTPLVGAFTPSTEAKPKAKLQTEFIFSLNTSTIRGQKLSLPQMIEQDTKG